MRAAALAVLLAAALGVSGAAAEETEETPESLPEGPGRDETFYACTACHGFALVGSQGMTRSQWDETLLYMVQRHSMQPLEAAERKLVLDYLAERFPPRKRVRENPFLKQ